MKFRHTAYVYAKAFFECEQLPHNQLENFESFYAILQQEPHFMKLLKSPKISLEEKKEILQECLEKCFSEKFVHFISILVEKKLLDLLPLILSEYRHLVHEASKILEVTIVTATSISPTLEQKVREKLESKFQNQVKLLQKIDSKMIGGAILLMGNSMIDWSIRERLKKLKETLLSEGT